MANKTYQYSNGFDLLKVTSALAGRMGWIQPTSSGAPILSTANKTSKSGRYFNDGSFHSLLNINNIKLSQEDAKITDENLNALLIQKANAAALRAVTSVFNEVEYYDRQKQIYDRSQFNERAIENTNLAVGLEILIPQRIDITAQIITATLYFNADVTFNLYLFKDGKHDPVWQQEVSAIANDQTTIDFSDLFINYANDFKGDRYYLVYFQSDLGTAKAIQEQVYELDRMYPVNHQGPNKYSYLGWNQTNCIRCTSFIAPATSSTSFDIQNRSYPFLPYGLNLEVSSFRDWTQDILKRPALFDNLIGLCLSYMVIEDSIYTSRSNSAERINKDDLQTTGMMLDLKGAAPISGAPKITGLADRIQAEANRVKNEFLPKRLPKTINLSECYIQRPIPWGLMR